MQHRKAMTRFQGSAHGCAIEQGRYTRPPTPLEQRTCNVRPNKPKEDKFHFLMECDKAKDDRNILLCDMAHICPSAPFPKETNLSVWCRSVI